MRASPINPSDLIPVTGAYSHRTSLPFTPGFEGVGEIVEVGEGVDPLWIGRRVLPVGAAGNWQGWKLSTPDWCVEVPDDIGDDQAALAYINPMTALAMVRILNPRPGDVVAVTAAASAIGRMLLRMLAATGARPIAIVRSRAALVALDGEPASVVLDGSALPRLDGMLDAVGGAAAEQVAEAIKPGAPLIHYGLLSGQPLTRVGAADLKLFRLRDWVHSVPRANLHAAMKAAFAEIRTGRAASVVAARYPLTAFREALAHDARGGRQGKIILQM